MNKAIVMGVESKEYSIKEKASAANILTRLFQFLIKSVSLSLLPIRVILQRKIVLQ
jgi:hypothetical protein